MEITSSVIEEGIASYSISFYEVLQALGVLSFVGLAFVLGLKFLRLLPKEAKMPPTSIGIPIEGYK
jgi:Ni/Fe-hydrogenase subunit HybB-like protein